MEVVLALALGLVVGLVAGLVGALYWTGRQVGAALKRDIDAGLITREQADRIATIR